MIFLTLGVFAHQQGVCVFSPCSIHSYLHAGVQVLTCSSHCCSPADAGCFLDLSCARPVCVWISARRTVLGPR